MTIIKTFETEEIKEKLPKKYIILVICSLFTLILIAIWTSNNVVAFGEKFDRLTALEKNLRMENQILENEISKEASLANIASESAALGFSQTVSIQYIR